MAKKRKKSTNKKRVGAMALSASSPLVMYGSMAAGFFLGDKINSAIDTATGGKIDTKLIAGGQVGLGALLVFKKGGKKSAIKTIAGGVLLGAGAKRAMTAFGLAGLGGFYDVPGINGFQDVPAVGGYQRNMRRIGNSNPGNGGMGWSASHVAVGSRGRSRTMRSA